MAARPYIFAPKYTATPTIGRAFNAVTLGKWVGPLTLWGGATGATLFFFADSIPVLRRMIYEKIPAIGSFYDDSVDPQSSPF